MNRIVKCAQIQLSIPKVNGTVAEIKDAIIQKHLPYIEAAGEQRVNILCLQELFFCPYFCAEQNLKWFAYAENVTGPTISLLCQYAKRYQMVIIAPIFEKESAGLYYNTAVIIDADGQIIGKMRKIHIPQTGAGFWEKFYFKPGNLGFPVFNTRYAKIGVFICYDRHFPECARILALHGAEILFNPCAASAEKSKYLWLLEQPAQAVANAIFIGANNRVGIEPPWEIGNFYGSSYFVAPDGKILSKGSEDTDELVIGELDLSQIDEQRIKWPFFRDLRTDVYKKYYDF